MANGRFGRDQEWNRDEEMNRGGEDQGRHHGGRPVGRQPYGDESYGGYRQGGWPEGRHGQPYGNRYGGGPYDGGRFGSEPVEGGRYGGENYEGPGMRRQRYGNWMWNPQLDEGDGMYGPDYSRGTGMSGQRWNEMNGPHVGRGPKNYQRADERIKEEISDRLEQHGHIDASEITVELKHGVVTLSGTVENRQMKRLAEDIAENSSGVKDVQNQLRVSSSHGTDQGRQESGRSKDKDRESARQAG